MQPPARILAVALAALLTLPGIAQAVTIRITGDEPVVILPPLPDPLKIRGSLVIPDSEFGSDSGSIEKARWEKLEIMIADDRDWTEIYYDDMLTTEYSWIGGVIGAAGDLSKLDITGFSLTDGNGLMNPVTGLPFSYEPEPDPMNALGLTGNLDTYTIRNRNGDILAQGNWTLSVVVSEPGIKVLVFAGLALVVIASFWRRKARTLKTLPPDQE